MMNELIKVNCGSDNPTVSGRDLHRALGIKARYSDWFSKMLQYGFVEGLEYSPADLCFDHALTISMARTICLFQPTWRGAIFREYLAKVEEAWNSPEKVMERGFWLVRKREIEAKRRIFFLEAENEVLEMALNEVLRLYTKGGR